MGQTESFRVLESWLIVRELPVLVLLKPRCSQDYFMSYCVKSSDHSHFSILDVHILLESKQPEKL